MSRIKLATPKTVYARRNDLSARAFRSHCWIRESKAYRASRHRFACVDRLTNAGELKQSFDAASRVRGDCESVADEPDSPHDEGHRRSIQALANVPGPGDAAGAFWW